MKRAGNMSVRQYDEECVKNVVKLKEKQTSHAADYGGA